MLAQPSWGRSGVKEKKFTPLEKTPRCEPHLVLKTEQMYYQKKKARFGI